MNSETIQRYVRVAIYYICGALGTYGVTVPDSTKALIVSIVAVVANLAWTVWGTKLSNLLSEVQAKSGVNSVAVSVDPTVIKPADLAAATPDGVTVKAQ
jgi:hypothetical protein